MIKDLSIAVLPFDNLSSNNENEYFCDGLTEEIINALSKINGLKVTTRTSSFFFKGSNVNLTQIGKELNVSVLVSGSLRLYKDKIRISAQLIEVKNDLIFWSNTWDNNLIDIFSIQDEISLEIADRIRENFGHIEFQDQLITEQTKNIEAYRYYLKGQYHYCKWNPTDTFKAIDYFSKAIKLDKNHILSYCGLIESYAFLGASGFYDSQKSIKLANSLITKAKQLNYKLPEFYIARSSVAFWLEWDIDKTLYNINKAFSINPNFPPGLIIATLTYTQIGNFTKALSFVDHALVLDPFSTNTLFVKSWIMYLSRNFQQGIEYADRALKLDREFVPALIIKACCLLKLEQFDEVIEMLTSNLGFPIDLSTKFGVLGTAYILKKDCIKAEKYFSLLSDLSKKEFNDRVIFFQIIMNSVARNTDEAFKLLEAGLKRKLPNLLLLLPDPLLNNISKDTRFKVISSQINLTNFIPKASPKLKKQQLMDQDSILHYFNKLIKYMEANKPYLEQELTMRLLASQLELHPNKLSWLINERLEKNFTDFINEYRIEYFKKLTSDSSNKNISILGLAYESGFSSKTGFYNSFKKLTKMTPKQYINFN